MRDARVAACFVLMSCAGLAWGQAYPNRVVRIVTAEAGGGSDLPARVIAQALSPGLGQPVIVENHGGGVIAGEIVAKASPDGHSLLFYGNTLWLLPLMRTRMNYDPIRDFAPITSAIMTPMILVVHPTLPVNSVKELISLAKSKPGQLNYSSAATGTTNHLAAELLKSMASIDMVRVPYKGFASALNAILGNETQVFFAIVGPGMAQVKAGKLRALAVTSSAPSSLAPGLPTMAEAGNLPGYESVLEVGVFAPTGTPPAIITRLNREITQLLQRPEVKDRLLALGMETAGSSPEAFAAFIKNEVTMIGTVVKEAKIRDD